MSEHNHDHHHHEDPIQQAIKQSVAQALTHPAFIQSVIAAVHEQSGMASLASAERMRPVSLEEGLVQPQAYNERGDTLLLTRRRLRNVDNAFNIIVTFSADNAGDVTYTSTIYKDHPFDTLTTKFIEMSDPAALSELNRQIAGLFKPEMADKSIQLTMLTCPELLKGTGKIAEQETAQEAQPLPAATGEMETYEKSPHVSPAEVRGLNRF